MRVELDTVEAQTVNGNEMTAPLWNVRGDGLRIEVGLEHGSECIRPGVSSPAHSGRYQ